MMKKMGSQMRNNGRLLVTAICVATLGALSQTVNVQAATTDSDTNTAGVSETSLGSGASKEKTLSSDEKGTSSESETTSVPTSTSSSDDEGTGSASSESEMSPVPETTDTTDAKEDASPKETAKIASVPNDDDSAAVSDPDKDETKTIEAPVVKDLTDTTTSKTSTADTSKNKVHTEAHITVTNSSGKASTTSTDIEGANSVIEENDNNQYMASLTYTDATPSSKDSTQSWAYPTFFLPSFFENDDTAAQIVADQGVAKDANEWQNQLLSAAGLKDGDTIVLYHLDKTGNAKTISDWGSDFNIANITGIQFQYPAPWNGKAMPANTTYTVNVPLKVESNDTTKDGLSYISVSDGGASSGTTSNSNFDMDRTSSFRIGEQTTTVDPGTDPADAPVIATNSDATESLTADDKKTNGIHTEAHIEVNNGKGEASTQSTDVKAASSTIAADDENQYSAVFTYTDKDTSAKDSWGVAYNSPTLYLPSYFTNAKSAANIVADMGTATNLREWQNNLLVNAGLPANTEITYKVTGNSDFTSLNQLGTNVQASDIQSIKINYDHSFMPAGATYTLTVPLKVVSNDADSTNLSYVGVADQANNDPTQSGAVTNSQWLTTRTAGFRIAEDPTDTKIVVEKPEKISNVIGTTYPLVTEQQSNVAYTVANPDLDIELPRVEEGDITVDNDVLVGNDTSSIYANGNITVNKQALDRIADLVNKQGYSLILNNDGTIGYSNYKYYTGINGPTVLGESNATGTGTESNVTPGIYITLRQLINTKNTDLTVGDSWKDSDNLADVTIKQDIATPATAADLTTDPTAANHVSTTISDPDGILDKDGKATKAGTFTITYSMKDGKYTVSKTAKVTVQAAKINDNGGSTHHNNGGTTTTPTDNNGGSTTTDNGNDDSNTSTGTGTETTDPDTPVVSPNEVPDEVPVVSPNEIPDISELTGNNSSENSVTDNNVTTNADESVATGDNVVSTTATKTSNSQTPVYTVGTVQNNASGTLTGYTPTTQALSKAQTSTTAATFPQTGNANDSKLQVIGAMIVSMMATLAGFAFGKKRHAEKA